MDAFLFTLTGLWLIFALVQDCRTREIANWLNYSLLAFGLVYRTFVYLETGEGMVLLTGFLGLGIFFVFANAFYYTRVFAGGDAKLLIALGAVLPYQGLAEVIPFTLGFLILLFVLGAVYTLVYSIFLVRRNYRLFSHTFKAYLQTYRWAWYCLTGVALLFLIGNDLLLGIAAGLLFILTPLFCYLKALEKSCMLVLLPPSALREGDWLEQAVRVGKRTIPASVHGLTHKDIQVLRSAGKRTLIRQGIPFAPAFILTFIIMVYAVSIGASWSSLASLFV
ncbi:prepilin peptidase [Candidatus Pacearchaeota archaeon]|nr:prepilin peptidase [Candidatus Pacearchaeota archaeon]